MNSFTTLRPALRLCCFNNQPLWIAARLVILSVALGTLGGGTAGAALLDVWRADDLNLNDGDVVSTWASASNRVANAAVGQAPALRRNVTPGGTAVVRFNGTHLLSAPSPVGGRTAFSVAIVFKANAAGAGANAQWWGKTGLVDAEEPGVQSDWGTVLTEGGQVGLGTGNGDSSTYSTGASLVDTAYHVAVFTWGGASQSVYVDSRAPVTQGAVSGLARNNAGIAIGGIRTGEADRRLNGDLAEIRFYDTALSSVQASGLIQELRDVHILGNQPRVISFTANTNFIYLGASATLSWNVSNAASVFIDQGVGEVALQGNLMISPVATTTYSLTATNTNGVRMATATVTVDPGVPTAFNLTTNTLQNSPVAITLPASDPQGSNLTYSIVAEPTHGDISGSLPDIVYTPDAGYSGLDTFTFKVNDGMFDSPPATVSVEVIPPPTPPSGIILSSTNIAAGTGPGGFVAALRAIDVNIPLGDTHTFTLVPGFGDNATFTISGQVLNAGPAFFAGPGLSYQIRVRATDSSTFTVEQNFTLTVVEVTRTVVINEIHHNSPQNTVPEEFIELYNPTADTVDLSNWRLRGGVEFVFPPNTFLTPGAFLVVAESPATIQGRYGAGAFGPGRADSTATGKR